MDGGHLAALALLLAISLDLGESVRLTKVAGSSRWDDCYVPKRSEFEKNFRSLTELEKVRQISSADAVRLVVGVFSRAGCKDFWWRELARSTWMSQPGICPLTSSGPVGSCSVYVTFVVGTPSLREFQGDQGNHSEKDVTVLPTVENMNHGKTRLWFEHATKNFGWATHVVKMDSDAFPHLSTIVERITHFSTSCEHVYGGVPFTCKAKEFCPPADCDIPLGNNFLAYKSANRNCWSYMQGGLYFMTAKLAAEVSKPGGWWDRDAKGNCYPEDLTTGHAVSIYARANHMCVAALKFEGQEGAVHYPHAHDNAKCA